MFLQVRQLLGLPQHIRQNDNSHEQFEALFQRLDADSNRMLTLKEFAAFFSAAGEQHEFQALLALARGGEGTRSTAGGGNNSDCRVS